MHFFEIAASSAIRGSNERNHLVGAVGIRWDGKLVSSKNGAVHSTSIDYHPVAFSHAEARLCRKLGKGGIVYVARVARKDGAWVMARPCGSCQRICRSYQVKKVYYTINEEHYGLYLCNEDKDLIFKL